jgi:hypothetical protein
MPNDPEDTMSVFIPTRPDRIPDTPDLSTAYCPVCEPIQDEKAITRPVPCSKHGEWLAPTGDADSAVSIVGYISGSSESTAESNRIMADLLRGDRNETEAPDLQTEGEA